MSAFLTSLKNRLMSDRPLLISHALIVLAMLLASTMILLDYIGAGEEGIGLPQALGLAASFVMLIAAFALIASSRHRLLILARSTAILAALLIIAAAIYWVATGGPKRLRYLRQQAQIQFEPDHPIQPANLRLQLDPIAAGLVQPVAIVSGADDTLYIVQRLGTIRIFRHGALLRDPFLDLSDRVLSTGKEQGLLGLAFYPPDPHIVFIYYTTTGGTAILSRFTSDGSRIDPSTEEILVRIEKKTEYHNGGNLIFAPDGYLYLGVGDDEQGNINAQNGQTLLGKILRLDVSQSPYAIPADNPFVDDPAVRDEIWALGLRNPWRFSFDSQSGDLYIADVGEHGSEEINRIINPKGGYNFGWEFYEGLTCRSENPADCQPDAYTMPILTYPSLHGCAITGGFVYRGSQSPSLVGSYLFADYCNGYIWALTTTDGAYTIRAHHFEINTIATFGQDSAGELYLLSHSSGTLYHITAP